MGTQTGSQGYHYSIKNSFFHVVYSDASDGDGDSADGGSSQRSSSVPSRMDGRDHDDLFEDWHRRNGYGTQQQWIREHPDLTNLSFDWGLSQHTKFGPKEYGKTVNFAGVHCVSVPA